MATYKVLATFMPSASAMFLQGQVVELDADKAGTALAKNLLLLIEETETVTEAEIEAVTSLPAEVPTVVQERKRRVTKHDTIAEAGE